MANHTKIEKTYGRAAGGRRAGLVAVFTVFMLMAASAVLFSPAKPTEVQAVISGLGTAESPYTINDATDLARFMTNSPAITNRLSSHYRLTADINLTAYLSENGAGYNDGKGWTPVDSFSGTFDGAGRTIRGLKINLTGTGEDSNNAGLFNTVTGTVRNLVIEGAEIRANDNVGVIAGRVSGAGRITGCSVSGKINARDYAGGIVGRANSNSTANITGCGADIELSAKNYAGGIMGYARTGVNIKTSSALGKISAVSSGEDAGVGGIIGRMEGGAHISDCFTDIDIVASGAEGNVGGIVGRMNLNNLNVLDDLSRATVSNCYALGEVAGTTYVGGIAGYVRAGEVKNCAALNAGIFLESYTNFEPPAGRVVGGKRTGGANPYDTGDIDRNVAYDRMPVKIKVDGVYHDKTAIPGLVDGKTEYRAWMLIGPDQVDGKDITAAQIYYDGLNDLFSEENGWSAAENFQLQGIGGEEGFKLPGLAGKSEEFRGHFKFNNPVVPLVDKDFVGYFAGTYLEKTNREIRATGEGTIVWMLLKQVESADTAQQTWEFLDKVRVIEDGEEKIEEKTIFLAEAAASEFPIPGISFDKGNNSGTCLISGTCYAAGMYTLFLRVSDYIGETIIKFNVIMEKARSGDLTDPVTLDVDETTGKNKVTDTSIGIKAVSTSTGQGTEYAITTEKYPYLPDLEWVKSRTFENLKPSTTYYIYARPSESANYSAGEACAEPLVVETEFSTFVLMWIIIACSIGAFLLFAAIVFRGIQVIRAKKREQEEYAEAAARRAEQVEEAEDKWRPLY